MRSGFIYYKEFKYPFEYENGKLILSDMTAESVTPLFMIYDDAIENYFFEGKCFPDDHQIIFYKHSGFKKIGMVITFEVDMVIEYRNLENNRVNGIEFYSNEISKIYGTNKLFKDLNFSKFHEDGSMKVEVNNFSATDSKKYKTKYKSKNIDMQLLVRRHIKNSPNPIDLPTILRIGFDKRTKYDYHFIYDFIFQIKLLISYLTYRRNIKFEKINLLYRNDKNKYEIIGSLEINDKYDLNILPDEDALKKCIPFDLISEQFVTIFEKINSQKLYTRHIPFNQKDKNRFTPQRIIMIASAFENEFKKCCEEGIPHNDKTLNIRKKLHEILENCEKEQNFKSREKREWQNIKNSIFFDNLSSRIIYCFNKYESIIKPFIEQFCSNNNMDSNINKIAVAIEKIRNDFAHGNIPDDEIKDKYDYGFIGAIILEKLVYIMQLKKLGIDDDKIMQSLNKLFNSNLVISKSKA